MVLKKIMDFKKITLCTHHKTHKTKHYLNCKNLIIAFLVIFFTKISFAKEFKLYLPSTASQSCENMIVQTLENLKEVSEENTFEIIEQDLTSSKLKNPQENELSINCLDEHHLEVVTGPNSEHYIFKFSNSQTSSFDYLTLSKLQKQFLYRSKFNQISLNSQTVSSVLKQDSYNSELNSQTLSTSNSNFKEEKNLSNIRKKVLLTLGGLTTGAIAGALLSPNEESKSMNAYVFGGVGALTGFGLSVIEF
jgi:hypothetical protein